MIKYYIYHPFDKLHQIWINSFINHLKKNNIKFINWNNIDDENDFNIHFLDKIKNEENKENIQLLYICHPIDLLNNDKILKNKEELNKIKIHKILYITEPLNLLIYKKTYSNLINKYQISELWTYSKGNLLYYKPIYNIPFKDYILSFNEDINYINEINFDERIKNIHKIVFIGIINNERKKIIDMFKDDIIIIDNIWDFEEFKKIYHKYTYYLNIHRMKKCYCFETFRTIPILNNYGFILSENINIDEQNKYENKNIIFDEREKLFDLWLKLKEENKIKENIIQNLNKIQNNCILYRKNII
jgi:hypothetical protein